ncbi:MAG: hypothetical protein E5W41_00060 [Mesorhizobium sp.]|nr:MAG: hypothetical protein E5W41_00060 [Mesorhizobium sp.]
MNEQRAPKFPATFCSQCGRGFGPGDHGFSHCEDDQTKASKLIPHVHDEIPADIMKAATEIAYSAETGVVVGSFPGAVYIAQAILAERQRFVAEFDGAADAGIDAAIAAERERCIEAARKAGNFGDYSREELTADYGQPRWDMMHDIISAIRGDQ